MIMKKKVAK